MNVVDKVVISKVAIQRDDIKMVLSDLYDKLRHGVYNHMLPEKTDRAHQEDPKAKCKNGHTRCNVLWQLGKCCQECDGIGNCHLSFEEKDLFKIMHEAIDVLGKPPAEMPHISPHDFVPYEPDKKYNATPRWIARQLYRFAVGYWVYSDHSDIDLEKIWEKNFDNILLIAIDSLFEDGSGFAELIEMAKRDASEKEAAEFVNNHPAVGALLENVVGNRDMEVNGEEDIKALVAKALLLRMEYDFGHEYPGADMGVYGGVFEALIDGCLAVAGLLPTDRPKSYDFDDKKEYKRKLLEYESDYKWRIFEFMAETEGLSYGIR